MADVVKLRRKLRRKLREVTQNPVDLVSGLSESAQEEALTELQFEIGSSSTDAELKELLETVLLTATLAAGAEILQVPEWFIRRDAIEKVGDAFDMGGVGAAYKGTWENKQICIKELYVDGPDVQRDFLCETRIWYGLSHEHVIKMLCGCHVGKPLSFVSELAKGGNLAEFLKQSSENKSKMWRLLYQVAQGLKYLHDLNIVQSDIKCNNIVIGADKGSEGEIAKLCNFGFSHIRTLSIRRSIKELPSTTRWKAPECLFEQGVAANPTSKSDVYAFGTAIIEAVIGESPWGMQTDDDIIDQLEIKLGYPRPEGLFTDREWELVQELTVCESSAHMTIPEATAIAILDQLAKGQEANVTLTDRIERLERTEIAIPEPVETVVPSGFVRCGVCQKDNTVGTKFCGECGLPL